MSNKKRNKAYKGSGAAVVKPTITKVSAVKRNPIHQYWLDHKRIAKPALAIGGIAIVVVIVIIGLIDIIF